MMLFGLVNAAATISRLMGKLVQDIENVENFIDDAIIFTDCNNHLYHVSFTALYYKPGWVLPPVLKKTRDRV